MLDTISIYSDGTLVSTGRSLCLSLCLCPVRSKVCVPVVSIIEAARPRHIIILAKFNLKIIVLLSDICCMQLQWLKDPRALASISRHISLLSTGTRHPAAAGWIFNPHFPYGRQSGGGWCGGRWRHHNCNGQEFIFPNCIKINIR